MRRRIAIAIIGVAAACTPTSSAPVPTSQATTAPIASQPAMTSNTASPSSSSNMTIVGTAIDAKGGAMIVDDAGKTTYVDFPTWAPQWAGKRVVVSGTIEHRHGPACASDPTNPCGGIAGPYDVLVHPTVRPE